MCEIIMPKYSIEYRKKGANKSFFKSMSATSKTSAEKKFKNENPDALNVKAYLDISEAHAEKMRVKKEVAKTIKKENPGIPKKTLDRMVSSKMAKLYPFKF